MAWCRPSGARSGFSRTSAGRPSRAAAAARATTTVAWRAAVVICGYLRTFSGQEDTASPKNGNDLSRDELRAAPLAAPSGVRQRPRVLAGGRRRRDAPAGVARPRGRSVGPDERRRRRTAAAAAAAPEPRVARGALERDRRGRPRGRRRRRGGGARRAARAVAAYIPCGDESPSSGVAPNR